uniref:AMP deaminase-like isoform X1 n=1 Tax=Rhizophora mucronata TaxID=61149 RepID=A0A2P2LRJ4_RHIMU
MRRSSTWSTARL